MKHWGPHAILALILLAPAKPAKASPAGSVQAASCGNVVAISLSNSPAEATKWILCSHLESGQLDQLRWPNFADYRSELKAFYQPLDDAPAWIAENKPSAKALAMIGLLQDAEKKGLRPEDYDGPRWGERLARLAASNGTVPANDLACFDLALTVSAMRYISDLHNGRINPRYFQFGYDIESKKYNLAEFLRTLVVSTPDVASALEPVEPSFPGYRRTKLALEQYLALARQGDGDPLPVPTQSIKPGDHYEGIPQLTRRLQLLGDLPQDTAQADQSTIYSGALVKAIKHFQQRHGLFADGAIGRDTFNQLVMPLGRRVAQLQLTLERWRWLRPDVRSPLIMVNIPEFQLHAYSDHQPPTTMRVVVGKALDHQTPVFEDQMRYIIFRPYWNVPDSIVKAELIPAIHKSKTYLDKHQYEIVDHHGEVIPSDAVDAKVLRRLEAKQLEIRQKPGPGNSLGLAKFVFPNHYDVYMHGTPERGLFGRARRDFSHGCIRVENPAALAKWVLHSNPSWTNEHILAAMNGTDTLQVNLPRPIRVLILYGTATVEENGEVRFFDDVYGHDAALETALASGYPYPDAPPVADARAPDLHTLDSHPANAPN
jgi:murein L,D-transpeptidase YcbB/YkuD